MKRLSTVAAALSVALVFASVAAAQLPTRPHPRTPPNDQRVITIALQAGSDSYRFTGRATCKHEPKGYIYMIPAQLWTVEQSEGTRSVMLTFWRPASGSDMFTLYLHASGKAYAASTVKTPHGGSMKGSGEVTFARTGIGGTFTVNATADNGAKITGTLRCDSFGAVIAEGGN